MMGISLRKVTDSDIGKIQQWIEDIKAGEYMSRFYPKAFDGKIREIGSYLWFIIVDDDDAGTIWLEKDNINTDEATLGILIGIKAKQGQGMGRAAIQKVIELACQQWCLQAVELNVRKNNKRAIKCYESCGFLVIGEGIKLNDQDQPVEFYKMRFELSSYENIAKEEKN